MNPVDVPERAKVVALAAAGVGVASFWALLLMSPPDSPPFTPPGFVAASADMVPNRVVAVGGAFTAPTEFGGQGQAGWPVQVAERFAWQPQVLGDDGAGYLTPGTSGTTLPAQQNRIVAARPDVVLLAGGRADVGQQSPSAIATAAGNMVVALRRELPDARIVVLGPVATDATVTADASDVRDAIRAAVTATPNTSFVDPLDENWFVDAPAGAIASDGQHPTDVGHRLIADRLQADLVRLGVAPG